jgi:PKD repeat protein
MKGTVDILAFDVYPCQSGPCDYGAIDSAVQQIHAANVTNWEFIIQDFSSGPWRWPTPAEVQAQFSHWQGAGAIGYWVFAWDYQAQLVTAQSGNMAALQTINGLAVNPTSLPPPPSPTPSPSPSPSPTTPPLVVTDSASVTSGASPLTITFAASASGGSGPYSYQWAFGDGQSSSSQNPSHTYSINAHYTVNLVVKDANQALGNATPIDITVTPALSVSASVLSAAADGSLTAAFTGSPAGGAGPYTFAWSFGDGQNSTAQNPSHTYGAVGAYSADLTVTDSRGVSATSNALAITVSAMPAATAAANLTVVDASAAVGFTSAIRGGTAPFGYRWIFGDGSASIAQDPSHAYATAGTYTVGLMVTDAVGTNFSANSLAITVYPSLGVVASATPVSGPARLKVTFVAAPIGGLAPFTYSWSFGDGATGTGPNVTHTYKAGTYQPTLTVNDAAGGSWKGIVETITVVKHSPKGTPTTASLASGAPSSTPPAQTTQPTSAPPSASPSPVGSHDANPQRSGGAGDDWRFLALVGSFLVAVGGALSFARWLMLRT